MLFIAEIGLNHNGNFNLCYELIRQAKYAGADVAKFQLGWRQGEDEMNHMNEERLGLLKKWADYFDIELMFSIFTPEMYELAQKFDFNRYKIASRTVIDDPGLVKDIIASKKQTIVSLGMWQEDTLPFGKPDNVYYLWCRSKYPCQPWDMTDFVKDFKNSDYTGYSDHTIGIDSALMAITRGATIIEKHFTLDKSDVTIRDHALSSTPDEFKLMVELGREIQKKLTLGI